MRRALTALAAVVLLGLGVGAAPAHAQVPALPPPPDQATPVLELVAPTVSPACGDAILAVTLAPVILGGEGVPVPVDALPVFGPAFIVCGSIPPPPQRLSCSPDATIRGPIDTVTGTAAGTALPLDTSVFAPVVEQEFVLEDTLGSPVNTAGIGSTIAGTLTCTVIRAPAAAATAPAPEATDTDVSANEESMPELGVPDLGAPTVDYGAVGTPPPNEAQLGSAAAPISPILAGGPGFAYPIVFALPLLLLALIGYFGWVLTRPALAASSAGTPRGRSSSGST